MCFICCIKYTKEIKILKNQTFSPPALTLSSLVIHPSIFSSSLCLSAPPWQKKWGVYLLDNPALHP